MGSITASRTQLRPDPQFGSLLASKFINCLMHDGKKSIAQRIFVHIFHDFMQPDKRRVSGPRVPGALGEHHES